MSSASTTHQVTGPVSSADAGWWRQAVVYQIYPRSFADADGNGLGDLRGVISRIPYLAALSVDAVWLSPFYPSALADGGYVGKLFQEFAVAVSVSLILSLVVSLTLTPMMCARLLKPENKQHGRLYNLSERAFDGLIAVYERALKIALRHRFDYVDEPLVEYRTGHANLSSRTEERLATALRVMHRFLDEFGGREVLDPAAVRYAEAETCYHIGLERRPAR